MQYFEDSRDKTVECIGSVDINKEYQFVRQFWDCDISTENFWWIDRTHVLALTQKQFVLYEKLDTLSDWNGDDWQVVWKKPRTDYIDGKVLKYICTCTNNCSSRLITFEAFDKDTVTVRIYNPLDNMSKRQFDLTLRFVELGHKLVQEPDILCSYIEQSSYTLLSNAYISATIVDSQDADDEGDRLLIGIAVDKALRQWCVQYSLLTSEMKQIVGYGYVGPSGQLTGGEIPSDVFNVEYGGFTGVVQPVENLDLFTANDIAGSWASAIYGNGTQQWYVYKSLKGIVSHLIWDSSVGKFKTVTIPIRSNYSAQYASTSFYVNKIMGFLPGITTIGSMLPFDGPIQKVLNVLTAILSPSIYYLTPTWTKFAYLQQSIGQYAYVYYNSNNRSLPPKLRDNDDITDSMKQLDNKNDTPTSYDELSFNEQQRVQKIEGEEQEKMQQIGGFFLALLTNGVNAIAATTKDLVVNKLQGDNTDKDASARKLGQFFMLNMIEAAASDISMQGINTGMSAKVTAVKTLDMFYSTSADSKICAGPGYVNHNFVAQCVAQSISNRYIQAQQNGMLSVIWPLSILECKLRTMALAFARDAAYKSADISSDMTLSMVMGTGGGNLIGSALGLIAWVAGHVAQTLIDSNNAFMEILPELVHTLTPSDNATFSPLGAITDHRIDIEGKHSYGAKNVTMFWPCFDATNTQFTSESVKAVIKDIAVSVDFSVKSLPNISATKGSYSLSDIAIDNVTSNKNVRFKKKLSGDLYAQHIYCKGENAVETLPDGVAVVEGITSFLPVTPFKNEAIGLPPPVFPQAPIQDYLLSEKWKIGVTAIAGDTAWVFCKDTKVIDGQYSNIAIYNDFCGIAAPYTAIEVKNKIYKEYMRPYAVTPQCIALNQTGLNCIYDGRPYHAFDGVGQRIVQWTGSAGMNQQWAVKQYYFQINDHFKRSNILPPNVFIGNFKGPPLVAVDSRDKVYSSFENTMKGEGLEQGLPGEAKNVVRYSLPVFTEAVSTLPAVVRTLNAHKLNVTDGITTLTTGLRSMLSSYKAPKSVDFNINNQLFRQTEEYVCLLNTEGGGVADVNAVVATLGLEFIGATTQQAFFYSPATRAYYSFTGGTEITKQHTWARFTDVKDGRWDFVQQDVVFGCLANMSRLDKNVSDVDDDLTDNLFVARMGARGVLGEVTPPERTIFNTRSWYKTLSMPGGLCFQGPKRFVVNRFIYNDYMLKDLKRNKGKLKRLSREDFHPLRAYTQEELYTNIAEHAGSDVEGWVHNPFVLVTSPLGVDEDTDCMFEWELTFTWSDEMERLYGSDEYACVNIAASTMCPGGRKTTRPTHLFLTKAMYTRSENSGYYTFRFNSNNGAGNREQLFIWCDSWIAMTGLRLEYKPVTTRRQTPLTQQLDVTGMKEM